MKRIVYLMGVAFVLMLALVSCTSADADLSDTITAKVSQVKIHKRDLT